MTYWEEYRLLGLAHCHADFGICILGESNRAVT